MSENAVGHSVFHAGFTDVVELQQGWQIRRKLPLCDFGRGINKLLSIPDRIQMAD